jgi:hypothetical protein
VQVLVVVEDVFVDFAKELMEVGELRVCCSFASLR